MTKKSSQFTGATIMMVFVLTLVLGVMGHHGSVAKAAGTTGKTLADGGPPPPDDDSDAANVKIADGGPPPPDDDGGAAKVLLAKL